MLSEFEDDEKGWLIPVERCRELFCPVRPGVPEQGPSAEPHPPPRRLDYGRLSRMLSNIDASTKQVQPTKPKPTKQVQPTKPKQVQPTSIENFADLLAARVT